MSGVRSQARTSWRSGGTAASLFLRIGYEVARSSYFDIVSHSCVDCLYRSGEGSDGSHSGRGVGTSVTAAMRRRSHRPKPAFRKVNLDDDRRSDGRYLESSATPCPEGATLDWGWPPTYGSGPFALATPCTHVPGRYSGPSKFKSRVAQPWSWDIGSSTSAAWTSLNMVLSCRKARPFGLSTKLGLQESGRPSPKGTALWPEPCSMD